MKKRKGALRLCDVEGCGLPHRSNGLCSKHTQRMRNYGRLTLLPKVQRGCAVEECDAPYWANGYCAVHCQRVAKHGSPSIVLTPSVRGAGALNGNWRGSNILYGSAHARVRRERGRASDMFCVDCGTSAAEWSYDHTDPDELVDSRGIAYSADPVRYVARCVSCHRKFDGHFTR